MKHFISIAMMLLATVMCAAEVTGTVIKVYDGDTIRIQDDDGGKFKVRFADIDAPESTQEFGQEAKAFLSDMVLNKTVTVKFLTIDVYGRVVGTVYTGTLFTRTNVNEYMLKNGMAWFYAEYSKNLDYSKYAEDAKTQKIGLWKQQNPKAPWTYRKENKKK